MGYRLLLKFLRFYSEEKLENHSLWVAYVKRSDITPFLDLSEIITGMISL